MKFYTSISRLKALYLLIFLSISQTLFSQTDLASPYSRFGLGMITERQSAQQFGMGGAGLALYDPYRLNLLNPASYAFHINPVFEVGGIADLSTYKSSGSEVDVNSFRINNISLNFPVIRNRLGLAAGLVPFSVVENQSETIQQIGTDYYTSQYVGSGGLNQLYLGTAFRFFNKIDSLNNVETLSFGVNLNYFFGSIQNSRSTIFDLNYLGHNLRTEENISVKDFGLDFGLSYQINIIKRNDENPRFLKLLLGATYTLGNELKAVQSLTAYNYSSAGIRDTVNIFSERKGVLNLPQKYGLGLALDYVGNKKQRIRFAADYSSMAWSEYSETFDGEKSIVSEYTDNNKVNVGLEYTPDISSLKVLERMEYRAGFRYENTNLTVFNEHLKDYGISFGLSVPIDFKRAHTRSTFNLGAEYGKYGTTKNDLIQQEYVRFMVGLTLTPHFRDSWLTKRKYD